MAEKNYVSKSSVRARKNQFGEEVLQVGFEVKSLVEFAQKFGNERGYLNLTISPRKNPDERSTHSVYLDDYKPGQRSGAPTQRQAPRPAPASESEGDQVPF